MARTGTTTAPAVSRAPGPRLAHFLRLALGLSLALAAAARPAAAAETFAKITPAQVAAGQEKGESFLFIDTRPAQMFDLKHARGAMSLPAFALQSRPPLPRATRVVLYDAGAGATEGLDAARALRSQGHPDFFVMEGGLTAWEAQGLPIVAAPGASPLPLVDPIGADDLLRMIDAGASPAVFDLRPAAAFREGHVPGAVLVLAGGLDRAVARLAKTDLIVLYDDGGGEARDRAEHLRRRGFAAVKYLYGGILGWRQKSLREER
jgi:rhodanese-related sulfurtransferase